MFNPFTKARELNDQPVLPNAAVGHAGDLKDLWRIAFDSLDDMVFIHDDLFRIIWANHAYAKAAGISQELLPGKVYWECFPRGDKPLPGCREAMSGKHTEESELPLADGRVMRLRAFPIHDPAGRYLSSIHILQDITAYKRANHERRRAQLAIEHAADAVYLIGEDGHIQYANQAALVELGYGTHEIKGLHIADIDPDMTVERWPEHWEELKEKHVLRFESTHRTKTGKTFPVRISANYHDLDGEVFNIAIARNIAQLKATEAALHDSEMRYRNLFDHMTNGFSVREVVFDKDNQPIDYRFLNVNEAYLEQTGLKRSDTIGKTIREIIPGIDPLWIERLGQVARTGTPTQFEKYVPQLGRYLSVHAFRPEPGIVGCITDDVTELRRHERGLKALSTVNQLLVHSSDEQQLVEDVLTVLVKDGGYRFSWMGRLSDAGSVKLVPIAAHGDGDTFLKSHEYSLESGGTNRLPPVRAAIERKMALEQNILESKDCDACKEAARQHGFQSVASFPLLVGDELIGVLSIYAAEADAFDEREVRLLDELVQDLSYGIRTIRTRSQRDAAAAATQELNVRLDATLVDTIQAISTALEMRDPYTAGHERRVAQLAVAIAKELGFDDERLKGLHLGGLIHDIGKIYCPAEILSRPGKLSNAEFELIKSHAEVGYEIIKHVNFPWPVADIVHQHHERIDGSGYPQGLKGNAIVLEARILAVADVVEAMASHRPYRPGLGIEKALAEIEQGSGSRYDPEVAAICLRLFREKRFEFDADTLNR